MAKRKDPINIDVLGEDILHKILQKLPALSCGSAACVSRSWNRIITSRILSAPKLSSAFSLNSSLQSAVREVLEKVLSEPIRPQFAIASVGPGFDLKKVHKLITKRLGSQIPVITSVSDGILGREALTSRFREIQWELSENSDDGSTYSVVKRGVLLTIGYLPGLRATLVPSRGEMKLPDVIDHFVMDICEWTSSVSDSSSPAGVILFTDYNTDMKPVLQKMEYAFCKETVIVGDGGGHFLYQSGNKSNSSELLEFCSTSVALLFADDRNKPPGLGETQFHLMLSPGVSPIGPVYKAASVKERKSDNSTTWITARRESSRENLDGQTILDEICNEIGERIEYPVFYIGVTKRRKCSVGASKARWLTFHEFHEVTDGDEEYLFIQDRGVKTGDSFCFYMSDIDAARSSCRSVSDSLRSLKQSCDRDSALGNIDVCNKKSIFGGIIFSCCGRGEPFFGESNVDSLPFLENFPEVPLAGTFSAGEIGRASMGFYGKESVEESSIPCSFHVFSSVYLVMSYTPPLIQ